MVRSLAPAVVVLAMAAATATADPARTYAYVSHVGVRAQVTGLRSTGGHDFTDFYCTFTVQVPRAKLDHAPPGASPELLEGATTAHDEHDYTIQGDGHASYCTDLDHTWQLVTLDPHDDHHVNLAFSAPSWADWPERIILLALGLIILSYAVEKLTGKSVSLGHYMLKLSMWRSRRRIERIDKRLAKDRDARLARARVVETKRDAPPGN